MNILDLIGRKEPLFEGDINRYECEISFLIKGAKILVVGAAGSIGQAVTIELFKRDPKVLHAVDISENNMVELVRTVRSSIGYGTGEFKTFALDCSSAEFDAMYSNEGPYDYVFNLSALKHVRSEKDPYTLMRLIQTNIFGTLHILKVTEQAKLTKYFCVSTDKAANPVNMMGASKRIMEKFLMRESEKFNISMARFANVAFSDGSLLHGFNQRFTKRQPITAPTDVRRYFVTPEESGELCMLSGLLGKNRDIFFPKLTESLHLERFSTIAERYLRSLGYEPYVCRSEAEAREKINSLISHKKWPVFFFQSDTTGEKDFEEFYTENEQLDFDRFEGIGVISQELDFDPVKLCVFEERIQSMLSMGSWQKEELVDLFNEMIPEFAHQETGKYLDNRM